MQVRTKEARACKRERERERERDRKYSSALGDFRGRQ
jgi:hypothetical protein